MNDSIFSAMNRVRLSGSEDFLTEAFVFVLKSLLNQEPLGGLEILNLLSGIAPNVSFEDPASVSITTQVRVDEGRPDIEIREGRNTLVYVEVKHDSPLGGRQLERYLSELRAAPFSSTRLVLLTRSRAATHETTLARDEYHHVCWYEIHNWLSRLEVRNEICQYFVASLLSFLEEKQMSMRRVSEEYVPGVGALLRLMDMMEASMPEAISNAKHKRNAGWGWRGFNVGGFFYGIRHERPSLIVFENNMGNRPTYKRVLDLETVGFFSMDKDEQFECLVEFLRKAHGGVLLSEE